jgi:hypothetical protein
MLKQVAAGETPVDRDRHAVRRAARAVRQVSAAHKYLAARYADAVVLTFAQIEDLAGFALPELAGESRLVDGAEPPHRREWLRGFVDQGEPDGAAESAGEKCGVRPSLRAPADSCNTTLNHEP